MVPDNLDSEIDEGFFDTDSLSLSEKEEESYQQEHDIISANEEASTEDEMVRFSCNDCFEFYPKIVEKQ